MRIASVFQRRHQLVIHASSQTTDGVWIASDPIITMVTDCDDEHLGQAVVAALDGSRQGVPHPTDWSAVSAPLLRAGGARSWNAFAKGAACVGVEEEGGVLTLVPSKNLGPTDGFEPLLADVVKLVNPTSQELGARMRGVLQSLEPGHATSRKAGAIGE